MELTEFTSEKHTDKLKYLLKGFTRIKLIQNQRPSDGSLPSSSIFTVSIYNDCLESGMLEINRNPLNFILNTSLMHEKLWNLTDLLTYFYLVLTNFPLHLLTNKSSCFLLTKFSSQATHDFQKSL